MNDKNDFIAKTYIQKIKLLRKAIDNAITRDTIALKAYDGQYDYANRVLNMIEEDKEFLKKKNYFDGDEYRSEEYRQYRIKLLKNEVDDLIEISGNQLGLQQFGNEVHLKKSPIHPQFLQKPLSVDVGKLRYFENIVENAGSFESFRRQYPEKLSEIVQALGIDIDEYIKWRDNNTQMEEIAQYEYQQDLLRQKEKMQYAIKKFKK